MNDSVPSPHGMPKSPTAGGAPLAVSPPPAAVPAAPVAALPGLPAPTTFAPTGPVHVDIGAISDRGKVREINEDAFVVFRMGRFMERVISNVPESELPSWHEESGHLMMVADGLGGHAAGERASHGALASAQQMILRSPHWALRLDDPATRDGEIRAMFTRAKGYLAGTHDALHQQAANDPRLAGMGTTFTGAYCVGADLFVQHVGDSKAYLFSDGVLKKITRDHTVAQEYADMGVIPQEAVAHHDLHHVLTRALGGPSEGLESDFHHLRLGDGDRLLLCSDGLTDLIPDEEITEILAANPLSANACRALVDEVLDSGATDNVTVIVAAFHIG